ncbi:MAG: hypothetical protein IIX15_01000 [Clostridia bacterium]|nr:hypothetical protein [Clostridia bacterium]
MNATEKLYEIDSECFEFEASVLCCEALDDGRFAVVLNRTAFFPESGGQYADRGTLGEANVLDVTITSECITHLTDTPLSVGNTVRGVLDSELRLAKMQCHTGEHILCGLAHKHYGYENVGFHLGNGEMTMDLDGELTPEQIARLEREANEIVWRNVPVTAKYPDAHTLKAMEYRSKLDLSDGVRIVTVEGVDACACCAPHVKRTGEIGVIKVVDAIRYKGGMRLWVLCGRWALEDYKTKHDNILTVTRKHSVKPWQLVEITDKLHDDLLATRAALSSARRELADAKLATARPDGQGNLLFFEDEMDANVQRGMADHGADACSGICGVFSETENGYRYVCVSRTKPLRALCKQLNETLNGRGGGTDAIIQGTLNATREQIDAFFSK